MAGDEDLLSSEAIHRLHDRGTNLGRGQRMNPDEALMGGGSGGEIAKEAGSQGSLCNVQDDLGQIGGGIVWSSLEREDDGSFAVLSTGHGQVGGGGVIPNVVRHRVVVVTAHSYRDEAGQGVLTIGTAAPGADQILTTVYRTCEVSVRGEGKSFCVAEGPGLST